MEPKKDVKTVEEDDSSEDDFGADFSEDELDSDEVFFQSKASFVFVEWYNHVQNFW